MSDTVKINSKVETDKKGSMLLDRRYYFAASFGVVAVVVVLLLAIFVIRPLAQHFLTVGKDLQYRTQEATLLHQKVNDLTQLKQNYNALGDDTRKKILVAMPTDSDEPHLTSLLATLAGQSGVSLTNVTYQASVPAAAAPAASGTTSKTPSTATSSGSSVGATMSVTGPYANITGFLVNLEKGPRVIDVTSVQFTGPSPQITAQVTVNARYNPKAGATQ